MASRAAYSVIAITDQSIATAGAAATPACSRFHVIRQRGERHCRALRDPGAQRPADPARPGPASASPPRWFGSPSARSPARFLPSPRPPVAANGTLAPSISHTANVQRSHKQPASDTPEPVHGKVRPGQFSPVVDNQQAHMSHETTHEYADIEKAIRVILKKQHSYNKMTTTDGPGHPPPTGTRLICSLPDLPDVDIFPYSPNGRTTRELGGDMRNYLCLPRWMTLYSAGATASGAQLS
jgi:hypothetical protein